MSERDLGEALSRLPAASRRHLEDLRATLVRTLGDELEAMLLHGSLVRGDFSPGTSDIDVVLVLRDDARPRLEAIGEALVVARAAARIECLILGAGEIPRAADVFPLLFDDLAACHVVLAGKDPFGALVISDAHRRLRIEQELRDLRIRLRRLIAERSGAPGHLAGPIQRKLRQLRAPLSALLRLRGEAPKREDLATVLAAGCRAYGVKGEPLERVERAPGEASDALRALLDAAIADVDAREVQESTRP